MFDGLGFCLYGRCPDSTIAAKKPTSWGPTSCCECPGTLNPCPFKSESNVESDEAQRCCERGSRTPKKIARLHVCRQHVVVAVSLGVKAISGSLFSACGGAFSESSM